MAVESESELFGALRRFAAEGIDLVVIDGGDGTIREVITRLPEAYGGKLPRLAVVPNGKTNALALDLGVRLGCELAQILAAAPHGRQTKVRHALDIVRAGQAAPERRGFLFGLGAFVQATELAQANHARGFFDSAAIAVTLAGAAAHTLMGAANDPWRQGQRATASFAPDQTLWFLILASTLKRLPLGLKPFGPPREGLKVLSIVAPPRRLLRALPPVLNGRRPSWLADHGYKCNDLPAFDLDLDGAFVLDGEVFEGGALSVRQGLALEFVVP